LINIYQNKNYTNNLNEIICINLNCNDISKTKVSNVHKKVFKYAIDIDPLKFNGKAVEKSYINALHDGRIIECPIKKVNFQKIRFTIFSLIQNIKNIAMNLEFSI